MGIQGWQWLIIIALVLLLFGAPKLPALARSMGQSLRIFKSEVRHMKDEGDDKNTSESAAEEPVEGKVIDPKDEDPQSRGNA
ncbi:Sec-independent protein translocase subunit TatA [Zhihengliuella halotolerans]|uniref:Sec-independent protein translocase protein TatA n=1 Tax=Zhihengliuella halotolerans TaxID=370736 RepID=A0A4Q8ACF0_9MICC|nr:Sec-independent protein translocase subunit TatA [Zhihengliuella halotolerans]RZU61401.1 sec-independent protein translocase protein TatA [Zhihengliuella halotolerans]